MAGPSRAWFDPYWAAFRRDVHELLAWGYGDARGRITPNSEEEEITGFIAEAIQGRLNAPSAPEWCDRYNVKDNPPVSDDGRTGKRRKRPDLVLEFSYSRPRRQYVFEAKRLRMPNYPVSGYIGEEGLQCFLHEEYASHFFEVGMLGYVQSNSVEFWTDRLRNALSRNARRRSTVRLRDSMPYAKVIDSFPLEWSSLHERNSGRPITIYHLFLDCLS